MKSLFRKGFDWLDMGVRTAVMAFATVMLLALSLQVFMRFVLDKPLSWSEELALACFSWSMLLAIGLGVRQKTHVRMDILVDHLPKALSLVIEESGHALHRRIWCIPCRCRQRLRRRCRGLHLCRDWLSDRLFVCLRASLWPGHCALCFGALDSW